MRLLLWITTENRTKLKILNYKIWTTKSDVIQHHCFWLQKFEKLWTSKNVFKPANTQSLRKEYLKEERLTFIGMYSFFTFFHRRTCKPLKYLKWSVLWNMLTIFIKCSILDDWLGSEYVSGCYIETWQVEQICVLWKPSVFIVLPIIWKQFCTLFLRHQQ